MKDPIFQRLLNLHPKFSDLSLGRIKKLLKKIDFDENLLPKVIHIAGTNGKGSVCAYLSSILRKAGYRTGRYTSPHLVNWIERISVNDQPIFPSELYKTKIPRNIRVAEAPSFGKSILEYDGLSKGSLSYYSLSGEIIKDE